MCALGQRRGALLGTGDAVSSVNLSATYRVTAGSVAAHPVTSPKPHVPEDPVLPSPTGCRNLRATMDALIARHGSQRALADRLGIAPGTVSRMKVAAVRDDRAFAVARVFVETVAKCIDKGATVDDLLAGRLIEQAKAVRV